MTAHKIKAPREDLDIQLHSALSHEFHLFCEQEQLRKHATLDKNPYCVYGILKKRFKAQNRSRQIKAVERSKYLDTWYNISKGVVPGVLNCARYTLPCHLRYSLVEVRISCDSAIVYACHLLDVLSSNLSMVPACWSLISEPMIRQRLADYGEMVDFQKIFHRRINGMGRLEPDAVRRQSREMSAYASWGKISDCICSVRRTQATTAAP